jgi:DICT domain-containing protein
MPHPPRTSSPFAVLAAATPLRPAVQTKRNLITMSRLTEAKTLAAPVGSTVLAALQEARFYTPQTARCYQSLARRGVQVLLFAHGWSGTTESAPGLWLIGLTPEDPVREEWDILVCTPSARFGFASMDQHADVSNEGDRRFGWLTSRDTDGIGSAAESLLGRAAGVEVGIPAVIG